MRITNNGMPHNKSRRGRPGQSRPGQAWTGQGWTGLAALQRRLSPTTLSAKTVDDTFILSAQWK
ncbi:hypothetical protein [Pseudoglutamicibacter albus]